MQQFDDDDDDDGSEFYVLYGSPLPHGWGEFDSKEWEAEDKQSMLRRTRDMRRYSRAGFCSKCGIRGKFAHCEQCNDQLCDACQSKPHGAVRTGKACHCKTRSREAA